jgi:hypothetical protein
MREKAFRAAHMMRMPDNDQLLITSERNIATANVLAA